MPPSSPHETPGRQDAAPLGSRGSALAPGESVPAVGKSELAPGKSAETLGRSACALGWVLAAIAFFIFYGWMARIGNDLGWDDTFNFTYYGRSPALALAVYHEPNNHPLESFAKSLFYGLLRLRQPEYLRLTGALFVAAWAAAAWGWWRGLARAKSWAAAAAVVLMLFLGQAAHAQAMILRGYFLSMLLIAIYLLLLGRRMGWFEGNRQNIKENLGQDAQATRSLGRDVQATSKSRSGSKTSQWRDYLVLGGISALLLFTLPSNIQVLPALWLAWFWTAGDASRGAGVDGENGENPSCPAAKETHGWMRFVVPSVRHWVRLAITAAILTILLYAPILAGFAFGYNHVRHVEVVASKPPGFLSGMFGEPAALMRVAAPLGLGRGIFACALALAGLGGIFALALRLRQGARPQISGGAAKALLSGILLLVFGLAAPMVVAGVVTYPDRIKTPVAPVIWIGAALVIHGLTASWRERSRLAAGWALALAGVMALPSVAASTRFERQTAEVASFLATYCRPAQRPALICHNMMPLYFPLRRVFSPNQTLLGPGEIESKWLLAPQTKSGAAPSLSAASARNDPAWKCAAKWLLGVEPPPSEPPPNINDIQVLAIIDNDTEAVYKTNWDHPAIQALMQRLPRRSDFQIGDYKITVYER